MQFKDWFIENTLLSEITSKIEKQMDKVYSDPSEFPFKKIFEKVIPDNEEATRFIVPFMNDQTGLSILTKIEAEGYEIDFEKGLITKDKRSIRMGKYILDKKSPFTEEEKKWWITRSNPLEALANVKNINQYAIVISRNPFDIVRMGDFDEIRNQSGGSSCHGPHGSYFDCAISDANNQGAIAYVVNRSDLNNVDLNDKEIFYDDERNIDGIKPISRLRLRRFINKKDESEDLAIPEQRLYGKPIPYFYETLKNAMASLQSNLINSKKDKRPRMQDYILTGGHYQDTPASQLFNDFFGDKLDSGSVKHQSFTGNLVDIWQEECDAITEAANRRLEHSGVYAQADESDGHAYVSYGGSFEINIKKELFIDDFFEIYNDSKFKNKVDRDMSSFFQDETSIYNMSVETESTENLYFKIKVDINPEEQENPDTYRSFTEEVKSEIDDKYEKIKQSFMSHFAYTEYVNPNTKEKITIIKPPQYLTPDVNVYNFNTESQTRFKNLVFDFHKVEKDYDAFLTSKKYEPLYSFDMKKYQPIIRKIIEEVEKLDDQFDPTGVKYYSLIPYVKEKIERQFLILINYAKTSANINNLILQDLKNLYSKYERVEKSQKYLFDEPEFQPKVHMSGYEKKPTDIIQNMLAHEDPVKSNVVIDIAPFNPKNHEDFNASGSEEIDNFTVFGKLKIMFDSDKFSTEEHKMFFEFAEFIDKHFDELIKILHQQLKNILETTAANHMDNFFNTITKELMDFKTQTAKYPKDYDFNRQSFKNFLINANKT